MCGVSNRSDDSTERNEKRRTNLTGFFSFLIIKALRLPHQTHTVPIQRKRSHAALQMPPHSSVQKRGNISREPAFLCVIATGPNALHQRQFSHALQFGERFFCVIAQAAVFGLPQAVILAGNQSGALLDQACVCQAQFGQSSLITVGDPLQQLLVGHVSSPSFTLRGRPRGLAWRAMPKSG